MNILYNFAYQAHFAHLLQLEISHERIRSNSQSNYNDRKASLLKDKRCVEGESKLITIIIIIGDDLISGIRIIDVLV